MNFFIIFLRYMVLKKKNNIFELSKNLEIDRNVYIPQNSNLIIKDGVNITFLKDVIFLSEGQINFNGTVNNQ